MSEPGRREFAAAILIDTRGRLLFQQRDDIAGILHPGKIGLFGGHREGDETFLQCVRREIHEEIGLLLPAERFEAMAGYSGTDASGCSVVGEFFIARDIVADGLVVTEGSLLIARPEELPAMMPRFAPAAWSAVRVFMNGQPHRPARRRG